MHCADSRGLRGDGFTDPEPRTGYEPTGLSTTRPSLSKRLSAPLKRVRFQKLRISSLYPTTSHYCLRLKILLKALLCLKKQTLLERKASVERSQIYHSERKGFMSSSSQSLNFIGTGKPVAWLSHHKRLGPDEFSERGQPADVLRGHESVFRANPAIVGKSLLEGNRDHLLSQGRAELMMKQEHKVESLNHCTSELQQQAYAQRLSFSNKRMLNDWVWRTPITDILNLDENKFDCRKNYI